MIKNNKHACNQYVFDAFGRVLELQWALLAMMSNSQDDRSIKPNVENIYLVLELFNANEFIKYSFIFINYNFKYLKV